MFHHTDMQDKDCGDCYNIHSVQSQYNGNHKRGGAADVALNRVNIVAVTTILVLHVGVIRHSSCSSPLGLHLSSTYNHCALARKGGPGACPPGGGSGGAFGPLREATGLGAAKLPNIQRDNVHFFSLGGRLNLQ